MGAKRSSLRHSAFFDLESNRERDGLTRPQSMLRSTEWGGLTLLSLLAGLAFPPYFVSVMALAFLNAGGMLWVTHLNDAGRKRLREFEAEFAQGHALEERGEYRAAADFYAALVPRYADSPRIAQIAEHRIEHLRQTQPQAFAPAAKRSRAKAPLKAKAAPAAPPPPAAPQPKPKPAAARPAAVVGALERSLRAGLRRKPA